MKIFNILILATSVLWSGTAWSQQNAAGTWQGELNISADLQLTVQFIINMEDDGSYSALINSPDNTAINNMPASAVSISGQAVSLEFNSLNGAFNGQLLDGVLDGEWSQLDDSFPLVLNPFVVNQLSEAQIAMLLGEWSGHLSGPADFDVIFRFEQDEDGLLTGFLNVPAQGANDIPLDQFSIDGDEFSFSIPRINGRYEGVFDESGEGLAGTFTQGLELELNLVKGEYVAPNVTLLNLSEADMERLLGNWSGQLGPLTIVLRFERNEDGEFVSFVDSPTQGATDLPVSEVTFLNNRLTLKLALGAEFSGEMNGDEIAGDWMQAGMSNPLTVIRD